MEDHDTRETLMGKTNAKLITDGGIQIPILLIVKLMKSGGEGIALERRV